MNQTERRLFMIQYLQKERADAATIAIPADSSAQRRLLRALLNVRLPRPVSGEFLAVQDAYLQTELTHKGVTDIHQLSPVEPGLYLWQGDITTLRCDAIVNAANSRLLGCFAPNHACIDNCIHTFAGVQLRLACHELMQQQGYPEPTGQAKITPAYNLPCRYVLHTVGPIISAPVTPQDDEQLADCYRACLTLAVEKGLHSVAFCCISTGEFHFPNRRAAEIAVKTVRAFQAQTPIEVIFNVFKDMDYDIYRELLG